MGEAGFEREMTPKQRQAYAALLALLRTDAVTLGAQLPSFAELAARLQTSVKILQVVMPWLAEEGILEIVPSVGTFLRARPLPPAAPAPPATGIPTAIAAKTRLKLYVSEYSVYSAACWRRIIRDFELAHPAIRVELTQNPLEQEIVAAADVLVLEAAAAADFAATHALLPWVDDALLDTSRYSAAAITTVGSATDRRLFPLAFGSLALFVHTTALAEVGLADAPAGWQTFEDILATCDAYAARTHGGGVAHRFAINSMLLPLYMIGLNRPAGLRPDEMRAYLTALATRECAALLTPADVTMSMTDHWMVNLFAQQDLLCALGGTWFRSQAPAGWSTLPVPLRADDALHLGAMSIAVSAATAAPDAAITFARSLVEEPAQRALNTLHAYIPVLRHVGVENTLYPLHRQYAAHGFAAGYPPWQHAVRQSLEMLCWDVRTHRISVDEAMDRLATLAPSQYVFPRASHVPDDRPHIHPTRSEATHAYVHSS